MLMVLFGQMTVKPTGKVHLAQPGSTPIERGRCYEVYGWDSTSSLKEGLFVLKWGSFVCAWPCCVEQGCEGTIEEIVSGINMVKQKTNTKADGAL